jgi:hypothetical protein
MALKNFRNHRHRFKRQAILFGTSDEIRDTNTRSPACSTIDVISLETVLNTMQGYCYESRCNQALIEILNPVYKVTLEYAPHVSRKFEIVDHREDFQKTKDSLSSVSWMELHPQLGLSFDKIEIDCLLHVPHDKADKIVPGTYDGCVLSRIQGNFSLTGELEPQIFNRQISTAALPNKKGISNVYVVMEATLDKSLVSYKLGQLERSLTFLLHRQRRLNRNKSIQIGDIVKWVGVACPDKLNREIKILLTTNATKLPLLWKLTQLGYFMTFKVAKNFDLFLKKSLDNMNSLSCRFDNLSLGFEKLEKTVDETVRSTDLKHEAMKQQINTVEKKIQALERISNDNFNTLNSKLEDFEKNLKQMDKKITNFQKETNEKMTSFQKEINEKMTSFQKEINEKMTSFQKETNEKMTNFQVRFDLMDKRMERFSRIQYLMIFIMLITQFLQYLR